MYSDWVVAMEKFPTVGTTQRFTILRIGRNNVKEELAVALSRKRLLNYKANGFSINANERHAGCSFYHLKMNNSLLK